MKKVTRFLLAAMLVLGTVCLTACGARVNRNEGIPTAEQVEAAKTELGEATDSMMFSVNGEIYQFPMEMQDMFDRGWTIDKQTKAAIEEIPAYTVTTEIKIQKKGDENYDTADCYFVVENRISMDVSLESCTIKTFVLSRSGNASVILPKGITWESTFDEVVEAYQPDDDHMTDREDFLHILVTNDETNDHMELTFDVETRTLSRIKFF